MASKKRNRPASTGADRPSSPTGASSRSINSWVAGGNGWPGVDEATQCRKPRPESRRHAGFVTAAPQHGEAAMGRLVAEELEQAGLADSGLTLEQDPLGALARPRQIERLAEQRPLVQTPDQLGGDQALEVSTDPFEPICLSHRLVADIRRRALCLGRRRRAVCGSSADGRGERRIVSEDLSFQLADSWTWIDAELLDELTTEIVDRRAEPRPGGRTGTTRQPRAPRGLPATGADRSDRRSHRSPTRGGRAGGRLGSGPRSRLADARRAASQRQRPRLFGELLQRRPAPQRQRGGQDGLCDRPLRRRRAAGGRGRPR